MLAQPTAARQRVLDRAVVPYVLARERRGQVGTAVRAHQRDARLLD
jgi:hypothetical protein